jgi:prepilin-type N-terminal cleavage/methylation domain-containing protein
MTTPEARRRRRAFTLLELAVSMAVLGLITYFLAELLVRQSRTYTVVDDVAEAQQNLRAIVNLIERDVRASGFLVPEAAVACAWDTPAGVPDAGPDVLYVTDADALDPTGVTNLALGAEVVSGYTGSGEDALVLSTLVLDGNAFYDLDDDGVPDSDFLHSALPARNGAVIVVDRANPERGVSCGVITGIDLGTKTVRVDFEVAPGGVPNAPAGGAQPGGTPLAAGLSFDLIAVPAHAYWIEPGPPPRLIRDGLVLGTDVEDLQVAFFYDSDGDGAVDGLDPAFEAPPEHSALEYPGSAAAGSSYQAALWNNEELREVRVTVVTRTRGQDPDVLRNPAFARQLPQAFENRVPGVVPDGFRRRALTLAVQPRNVGRRADGA